MILLSDNGEDVKRREGAERKEIALRAILAKEPDCREGKRNVKRREVEDHLTMNSESLKL